MTKLFDRAESCRSRATELRELAAKVREPEARTPDMLEEHAHTLEAVAIKFGVARRAVMREAAD
jgi:hypothetical protein